MTRNLSGPARAAIIRRDSDDPFLVLLTVEHEEMADVLRVVNNNEPIVSLGFTFSPYAFNISLPDDSKDQIPSARIEISNIDRQIVDFLRSVSSPPSITIQVVMASTPSTIEASWEDLYIDDIQYDASVVQMRLTYESILDETFTAQRFDPADYPGLF